jgi:hypothetical protein
VSTDTPWWDYRVYEENRRRFPQDELNKYSGQHVAFSRDGTRILASGKDMEEVEQRVVAAGLDPSQVVFSYIDPPDLVLL